MGACRSKAAQGTLLEQAWSFLGNPWTALSALLQDWSSRHLPPWVAAWLWPPALPPALRPVAWHTRLNHLAIADESHCVQVHHMQAGSSGSPSQPWAELRHPYQGQVLLCSTATVPVTLNSELLVSFCSQGAVFLSSLGISSGKLLWLEMVLWCRCGHWNGGRTVGCSWLLAQRAASAYGIWHPAPARQAPCPGIPFSKMGQVGRRGLCSRVLMFREDPNHRAQMRWLPFDHSSAPVSALSWSPSGHQLACASFQVSGFTVCDVATGRSTHVQAGVLSATIDIYVLFAVPSNRETLKLIR